MKFDPQKAFPYPVLRPYSDDFRESDFQVTVDFIPREDKMILEIFFDNSCQEIAKEIEKGRASYATLITCRETYFRHLLCSQKRKITHSFQQGFFRGEVDILSYVVVKENINNFTSSDINEEFGPGPFNYSKGDILAQAETQVVYIERDLFRPVTSVFDIVKKDNLKKDQWAIEFEQDHVQIAFHPKMKEKIDNARNNIANRAVLLNSIYFVAVMQAIQNLKDDEETFSSYKWAQVIKKKMHNEGISVESVPPCIIVQRLMKYPLSNLDTYVFSGEEE